VLKPEVFAAYRVDSAAAAPAGCLADEPAGQPFAGKQDLRRLGGDLRGQLVCLPAATTKGFDERIAAWLMRRFRS